MRVEGPASYSVYFLQSKNMTFDVTRCSFWNAILFQNTFSTAALPHTPLEQLTVLPDLLAPLRGPSLESKGNIKKKRKRRKKK